MSIAAAHRLVHVLAGGSRIALLVAALLVTAPGRAAELDCTSNVQRLRSFFRDYGPDAVRRLTRDTQGIHFCLSDAARDSGQVGLFSYFALAGDFEVTATFELLSAPAPRKGYGTSCGIALDADGHTVSLVRGQQVGKRPGYLANEGRLLEGSMKYTDLEYQPTTITRGRLILRREGTSLICLVSAKPATDPEELCRVEFPGIIRKVRLFADPGGSPNVLDARLTKVRIQAEDIITDVLERAPGTSIGWWLATAAIGIGLGLLLIYRTSRVREPRREVRVRVNRSTK
jgi:hypothetical protein